MAPLWFKDRSARNAISKVRDGTAVEWCRRFDERFDVFWETLSRERAEGLLAVRSREILQWHFRHALDENKVWILTVRDRSDLAAYAIFLRQGNPKYGLERIRLIDFQALDGHRHTLAPMLAHALRQCRTEKVHMLEYIGVNEEAEQALARLAPLHRTLPSWLYYYKAQDDALARELADTEAWSPTSFDGDSSL
jgi:hypothetical protein